VIVRTFFDHRWTLGLCRHTGQHRTARVPHDTGDGGLSELVGTSISNATTTVLAITILSTIATSDISHEPLGRDTN
jgi:hypothetical protein